MGDGIESGANDIIPIIKWVRLFWVESEIQLYKDDICFFD